MLCCGFISLVLFYFINFISVNTQNSQFNNIFKLKDQNLSVNNIVQSKDEFSFDNNECSRYCIETSHNHIFKYAAIVWNIAQDTLFTFNDESKKFSDSDIDKPMTCILYVNIGCKNSTFTNATINKFEQATSNDEKIFIVNYETKILQIKFGKKTNFSSLLLKVSLESQRINDNAVLELSLMHGTHTDRLNIMIINPSPNKWRMELIEIETKNSTYNNYNMVDVERTTMSIMTPKKVDLPVKIQSRSAENSEIKLYENENSSKIKKNNSQISNKIARILSNNLNDDLIINEKNIGLDDSTKVATNSITRQMKTLMVNLAMETKLIALPGTIHPIIFTITNYLPIQILCTWHPSTEFIVTHVTPSYGWIGPQQVLRVVVFIHIPNINENIVKTVTLHVKHESNNEDVSKSTYIYVQNTNVITDYTKPTIKYSFNNNCAGKLSQEYCNDNEWSTEITVIDDESGVRNVISQPDGIRPKINFISGMKGAVNLQYRATCCYTSVEIIAIDTSGNSYTQKIDVTAWDNLNTGEIAAIVVGTLFLLFIIIFLILLCIYCIKRRKSQDITFTQRYGSRSNPRAEGTNF